LHVPGTELRYLHKLTEYLHVPGTELRYLHKLTEYLHVPGTELRYLHNYYRFFTSFKKASHFSMRGSMLRC
jgi:hypothetical protein